MGKTKKLRQLAKSAREADRAAAAAAVEATSSRSDFDTERLPPPNEHAHCAWTGPMCGTTADELLLQSGGAVEHLQTSQTAVPQPESEQLCTLPPALRVERLHRYDAVAYPFASLIGDVIRPGGFTGPLHQIHQCREVQNWLAGVKKDNVRAYTMRRNYVDKRYKNSCAFQPGSPTGECYLQFLRDVVRPAVYAGLGLKGTDGCAILYQRDPNFRCHLPDTGHLLVHKHCDADYHHQQNEVNFWLAITRSFGNNTLWSESSPGRGDFHPFELEVGEMKQFWGNQCSHYTVPNDTDHTRITIDFRIIPLPQ